MIKENIANENEDKNEDENCIKNTNEELLNSIKDDIKNNSQYNFKEINMEDNTQLKDINDNTNHNNELEKDPTVLPENIENHYEMNENKEIQLEENLNHTKHNNEDIKSNNRRNANELESVSKDDNLRTCLEISNYRMLPRFDIFTQRIVPIHLNRYQYVSLIVIFSRI